jgi:hypothetical protein
VGNKVGLLHFVQTAVWCTAGEHVSSMRLLHDVLLGNNFLTGCRGQVCMESMVIFIVSRLTFCFFWFTLNTAIFEDPNSLKQVQALLSDILDNGSLD